MADGTIDQLRKVMEQYEQTADWWTAVTRTADEERRAESYAECVAYSERLEGHAHDFAEAVRVLLAEVDGAGVTPPDRAHWLEPLGGPTPGVNGLLPEHAHD